MAKGTRSKKGRKVNKEERAFRKNGPRVSGTSYRITPDRLFKDVQSRAANDSIMTEEEHADILRILNR